MEKALNQQSFQRKQSSRHFRETFEFAANDRQTSDTRELLDHLARSEFEKQDAEKAVRKLQRTAERTEDKIDHLTTMAEKEMRRCLRERKEEHLRKQGGQKKSVMIKRSRNRKRRSRRFNGSRGMRNAHSCEKASCGYMMQELKYNKAGLSGHMSYNDFLLAAAQKKAEMDKLDGVRHLRKDEDSLRNDTESYRMQVAEQTKWGQDYDEVGPTIGGTAYLVRQINEPSKMCKIRND